MELAGQAAIVTGASRGIGRESAIALARAGADIVVHGTNEALLEELATELGELGVTAIPFAGDVAGNFKAVNVRDGSVLWETHLATSVQGYPISFSVDGKQYVAVATGLGGGSPRAAPSNLTPEITVPNRGHALYVFALQ